MSMQVSPSARQHCPEYADMSTPVRRQHSPGYAATGCTNPIKLFLKSGWCSTIAKPMRQQLLAARPQHTCPWLYPPSLPLVHPVHSGTTAAGRLNHTSSHRTPHGIPHTCRTALSIWQRRYGAQPTTHGLISPSQSYQRIAATQTALQSRMGAHRCGSD